MKNVEKFGLPQEVQRNVFSTYQVPTEIVDLPSRGKLYPQDHPLKDVSSIEIKYMTTREEDILVSPSLNEKGIAIDRVLESLVVSHKINGASLIPGDKTAILIAARKSAYGSDYTFKSICPVCSTINEIESSIDDVKVKDLKEDDNSFYRDGNIVIVLPKTEEVVEMKILTSEDEKSIEETISRKIKNNLPAEELLTRYRKMIVSVNSSYETQDIIHFINNLGIANSRFLKKKYAEMLPNVEFNYSHSCKNCGSTMEGGVPIGGNFFWPDVWFHKVKTRRR